MVKGRHWVFWQCTSYCPNIHRLSCIHISDMFGCLHEISCYVTTKGHRRTCYACTNMREWYMVYSWLRLVCGLDTSLIYSVCLYDAWHISVSMVQVCEMCCTIVSFAGVYSKMNSLCRSLVILAVSLTSASAQLDSVRIFLNASDLNERFEGAGHVFQCELHSFILVFIDTGCIEWCPFCLHYLSICIFLHLTFSRCACGVGWCLAIIRWVI